MSRGSVRYCKILRFVVVHSHVSGFRSIREYQSLVLEYLLYDIYILLNYKGPVPRASWVTCCVAAEFFLQPLLLQPSPSAPGALADYLAMSFIFVY